jgi:hypothetical protein
MKMDTQGDDLAVAEGAGDLLRDFVAIQAELAIQEVVCRSSVIRGSSQAP